MPSKTQRKIQFAAKRGVSVYYLAFPETIPQFTNGWYVGEDFSFGGLGCTHGPFKSKREAKNAAYRLALGQQL